LNWYNDKDIKILYDPQYQGSRFALNQVGAAPWIEIEEKPSDFGDDEAVKVNYESWHLPSRDELETAWRQLHLTEYGDFFLPSLHELRYMKIYLADNSFTDWFLPSKDELNQIYEELYVEGVGGLTGESGYWSSSEGDADNGWGQAFDGTFFSVPDGTQAPINKDFPLWIRPVRTFTAPAGALSLRDEGQAGGLIFHIDGTTYYEAAPADLTYGKWSNIVDAALGTTGTAIGTGSTNTTAIIGQVGHTASAAKDCDDHSITLDAIAFETEYWASSEVSATTAWTVNFTTGAETARSKDASYEVRAVRSFIAPAGSYSLRDETSTGWIFYIESFGTGHEKYYEAAKADSGDYKWMHTNYDDVLIGTSAGVGEGEDNTRLMRGRPDTWAAITEAAQQATLYRTGIRDRLGSFSTTLIYWSSTERSSTEAWLVYFNDGVLYHNVKTLTTRLARSMRYYYSSTFKNIRETGEAGGLIVHVAWDGSRYRYLECALTDVTAGAWSNITDENAYTLKTLWTGEGNTVKVIGQTGHTGSAALRCVKYSPTAGEYNNLTDAISATTANKPYVLVEDSHDYNEALALADFEHFQRLYADTGQTPRYCTRLLDFNPSDDNCISVSQSTGNDTTGTGTIDLPVKTISKAKELFAVPQTGWFLGSLEDMREAWLQLKGSEYNQWYLPTRDEMKLAYDNLKDNKISDWFLPSRDELKEMHDVLWFGNQSDWFLPSKDELGEMHDELHLYGVGGFANNVYWSSSEYLPGHAWLQLFSDGTQGITSKDSTRRTRPIRTFIANTGSYALRDTGPTGGLIFHLVDNGGGTHTYYEAAPYDLNIEGTSTFQWGGRISDTGATGTAIGTGSTNTTTIVNFFNSLTLVSDGVTTYYDYDWDSLTSGSVDFTDGINTYSMLYLNNGVVAAKLADEYVLGYPQMGDFTDAEYWSSSEHDASAAITVDFTDGTFSTGLKGADNKIRPIRTFESVDVYNVREEGEYGWVFYAEDLGVNYKYYECAYSDLTDGDWSNVTAAAIGTTGTDIGDGSDNTDDIIAQAAHTGSAAKDCDDYDYEWFESVGLEDEEYWTSSEHDASAAITVDMTDGTFSTGLKNTEKKLRGVYYLLGVEDQYDVRDEVVEDSGYYVFHSYDNGDDTWTYLVLSPSNITSAWSDVDGIAITGTSTAVGDAIDNSLLIINQAAHTGSAALECFNINILENDVGAFEDDLYWTSSEYDADYAYAFDMSNGATYWKLKTETELAKPIRAFTDLTGLYNVGDGDSGDGWIFYISDLGSGMSKYYQVSPLDVTALAWSNITDTAVTGTSQELEEGYNNSLLIVAQSGHTGSAASECLDEEYSGFTDKTTLYILDSETYDIEGLILKNTFKNIVSKVGETPTLNVTAPSDYYDVDTAYYKDVDSQHISSQDVQIKARKSGEGYVMAYRHSFYGNIRFVYLDDDYGKVGTEVNTGVQAEWDWKIETLSNGNTLLVYTSAHKARGRVYAKIYDSVFTLDTERIITIALEGEASGRVAAVEYDSNIYILSLFSRIRVPLKTYDQYTLHVYKINLTTLAEINSRFLYLKDEEVQAASDPTVMSNIEIVGIDNKIIALVQSFDADKNLLYFTLNSSLLSIKPAIKYESQSTDCFFHSACAIKQEFDNVDEIEYICFKYYSEYNQTYKIHVCDSDMQLVKEIEEHEIEYDSSCLTYDDTYKQIVLTEKDIDNKTSKLSVYRLTVPKLIIARTETKLEGFSLTCENFNTLHHGIWGEALYDISCKYLHLDSLESGGDIKCVAVENSNSNLIFNNSIISDCDEGIVADVSGQEIEIKNSQFYRMTYGYGITVYSTPDMTIQNCDFLNSYGGILLKDNEPITLKNLILHDMAISAITADYDVILTNSDCTGLLVNVDTESILLVNPLYVNEGYLNPDDTDLNLKRTDEGYAESSPAIGLGDDGKNAGSLMVHYITSDVEWSEATIEKDFEGINIFYKPVNPVENEAKDGTIHSAIEAQTEIVELSWRGMLNADYVKLLSIIGCKNPLVRVYPAPDTEATTYAVYRILYDKLDMKSKHYKLLRTGAEGASLRIARAYE
jgi:hypothetical protein